MQINLPDNLNLSNQATAAGFANVEAYVFHLIERDEERIAIREGIVAMQQGRTRPFAEFEAEFRKKYGMEEPR